jgi:hypothetical protein
MVEEAIRGEVTALDGVDRGQVGGVRQERITDSRRRTGPAHRTSNRSTSLCSMRSAKRPATRPSVKAAADKANRR